MNASLLVKIPVSYPLYFLNRVGSYFRRNTDVMILMYHRILDKRNFKGLLQDAMYVNMNTFENHIIHIRKHYDLVSLETIMDILKRGSCKRRSRPLCCITFDDGWKDFYDNAYPVLKKYNAVATVFLPTDFIGTDKQLWTDMLAEIISKIYLQSGQDKVKVAEEPADLFSEIENLKGSISDRYEKAIDLLKKISPEGIHGILVKLGKKWDVDFQETDRSFVSWEEVKEMHLSGIVNFGSHTKSHAILTTIRDEDVRNELMLSREKLVAEGVVAESFIPFAYPNGNYNDRIAEMVEEAGYSLALTTTKGWNRVSEGVTDRYKLKRIGIHEDMTSTNSMFACRVHGYY